MRNNLYSIVLRVFLREFTGHARLDGRGRLSPHETCLRDPHSFDVHEFANAVGGEFAAMAGLLYPAKGNTRIGSDHLVDEHHTGFEFVDKTLALGIVVGPGAGAEAEAAVVREGDCFVDILHAE